MRTFLLIVLSAGVLSACAHMPGAPESATAAALGVAQKDVAIGNVDQGMYQSSWTAVVNGVSYNCTADDMLRNASCSPM